MLELNRGFGVLFDLFSRVEQPLDLDFLLKKSVEQFAECGPLLLSKLVHARRNKALLLAQLLIVVVKSVGGLSVFLPQQVALKRLNSSS